MDDRSRDDFRQHVHRRNEAARAEEIAPSVAADAADEAVGTAQDKLFLISGRHERPLDAGP